MPLTPEEIAEIQREAKATLDAANTPPLTDEEIQYTIDDMKARGESLTPGLWQRTAGWLEKAKDTYEKKVFGVKPIPLKEQAKTDKIKQELLSKVKPEDYNRPWKFDILRGKAGGLRKVRLYADEWKQHMKKEKRYMYGEENEFEVPAHKEFIGADMSITPHKIDAYTSGIEGYGPMEEVDNEESPIGDFIRETVLVPTESLTKGLTLVGASPYRSKGMITESEATAHPIANFFAENLGAVLPFEGLIRGGAGAVRLASKGVRATGRASQRLPVVGKHLKTLAETPFSQYQGVKQTMKWFNNYLDKNPMGPNIEEFFKMRGVIDDAGEWATKDYKYLARVTEEAKALGYPVDDITWKGGFDALAQHRAMVEAGQSGIFPKGDTDTFAKFVLRRMEPKAQVVSQAGREVAKIADKPPLILSEATHGSVSHLRFAADASDEAIEAAVKKMLPDENYTFQILKKDKHMPVRSDVKDVRLDFMDSHSRASSKVAKSASEKFRSAGVGDFYQPGKVSSSLADVSAPTTRSIGRAAEEKVFESGVKPQKILATQQSDAELRAIAQEAQKRKFWMDEGTSPELRQMFEMDLKQLRAGKKGIQRNTYMGLHPIKPLTSIDKVKAAWIHRMSDDSDIIRTAARMFGSDNKVDDIINQIFMQRVVAGPIQQRINTLNGVLKMHKLTEAEFSVLDDMLKLGSAYEKETLAMKAAKSAKNFRYSEQSLGIPYKEIMPRLKALQANNPRLVPIAKQVTRFNTSMLDDLVRGRVITSKMAKDLKLLYPNHSPLYRVFDKSMGGFRKYFGGGELPVQNSLLNSGLQAQAYVRIAESNLPKAAFVDWLETMPGGRMVAYRTSRKKISKDTLEAIGGKQKAPKLGEVDPLDVKIGKDTVMDPDDMMSYWQNVSSEKFTALKDSQFSVFRDGYHEVWELRPEWQSIKDAFRIPGHETKNLVRRFFAAQARVLRAGATGYNPEFSLFKNPFRDIPTAMIQGRPGTLFPPERGKQLKQVFRDMVHPDDWGRLVKNDMPDLLSGYWEDMKNLVPGIGGRWEDFMARSGHSGMLMLDRQTFNKQLQQIAGKRAVREFKHSYLDGYRQLMSFSENAVRYHEYNTALNKFLETMPKAQAEVLAQRAAQEVTLNFHKAGSWMKAINEVVPFSNAQVRDLSKNLEMWRTKPVQTALNVNRYVMTPSITLWHMNKDDPTYHDLPSYRKDIYYCINKKKVFGIDDPAEPWLFVPRPFTWGFYGRMAEIMLDNSIRENPRLKEDITSSAAKAFGINLLPPLPTLMFSLMVPDGFRSFTGSQIVPESQKRLPAEYQFGPKTSSTARFIAEYARPEKASDVMKPVTPANQFYRVPYFPDEALYGTMAGISKYITATLDLFGKAVERTGGFDAVGGRLGEAGKAAFGPKKGESDKLDGMLFEAGKKMMNKLRFKGDPMRSGWGLNGERLSRIYKMSDEAVKTRAIVSRTHKSSWDVPEKMRNILRGPEPEARMEVDKILHSDGRLFPNQEKAEAVTEPPMRQLNNLLIEYRMLQEAGNPAAQKLARHINQITFMLEQVIQGRLKHLEEKEKQ